MNYSGSINIGDCFNYNQTGGTNNTNTQGINFIPSVTNAEGMVATPSNPSTNSEKIEITGTPTYLVSGAGFVATAIAQFGYDTTNKNWHAWVNGADVIMIPLASGFVSGNCAEPTNTGGNWVLADAGGPCGTSGGGAAFSAITAGINTATLHVGTGGSMTPTGTGLISANELNGVPFCTGFTPTTGQNLQYTTASSPNPCYTAATAGGSGAWTQIQSQTISGTPSSLTFTSIPGTYNSLQLRCLMAATAGLVNANLTFNGDTTSGHYWWTSLYVDPGTTPAKGGSSSDTKIGGPEVNVSPDASQAIFDITGYALTSVNKAVQIGNASPYSAGSTFTGLQIYGGWKSTAAITSLTLTLPSSTFAAGVCTLYGIN